MSKRCTGRTKFGVQCSRYVTSNTCWEHGALTEVAPIVTGYNELIGETLATFVKDKENVHTKPVQSITQTVIEKLLNWGKDIETEPNLPSLVLLRIPIEPSETELRAYNHLLECYDISDDFVMFGTTYPRICTLVWHRVKDNDVLMARFFEEVSESVGLCLNGNMARLVNVFAGIDDELSPQKIVMDKQQFQQQIGKALSLNPIDCMEKVLGLCKEAQLTETETHIWIHHVTLHFSF